MKSLLSLLLAVTILFPVTAAAQDAELQAEVDEAHEQYAGHWSAGDVDGLLTLFADDAIYWPVSGGRFEGTDEIRRALEEDPTPSSATIEGTHLETIGGVIVDIGTFSVTMPDPVGEMSGEYVALLAQTDDGIRIQRLIGFPARQPTPAPQ